MKNMLYEEIPMRGEFPHYRKPRRRRTGRIVTFVLLIPSGFVLIIGGLGMAFRLLNPTPIHTTRETHIFNLEAGTQPTLIVTNDEGFVYVRPGTGNTVTVTATKIGDSYGASIEPKIDVAFLLSIAFGEVGAYALLPEPGTNGTRPVTTVVVKDARLGEKK